MKRIYLHFVNDFAVDSNDSMYGSDPKFLNEIKSMSSTLVEEILSHLKTLTQPEVRTFGCIAPKCPLQWWQAFLARLHLSAEELLLYPSAEELLLYPSAEELLLYPRRRRQRRCPRPQTKCMLGQMLKSWNFSLSVFFVAFKLCLSY